MLIEDFEKLLNRIELKRLHDISELQKGILRRQNRYKKILNIYFRLYEKWFTFINTREEVEKSLDAPITEHRNIAKTLNKPYQQNCHHDDDVFESGVYNTDHNVDIIEHNSDSSFDSGFYDDEDNTDNNFWDYHKLLSQIIERHLMDSDDLKRMLIQECTKEVENKKLLLEHRSSIEHLQMELSTQYNTEYKISRTISASNTPTTSYVGFMENVLNGMTKPVDEHIDFDEYSKYCQVKWTLESVEVESHSQCHKMFDQALDLNCLQDQILDIHDVSYAIELFKNYKNLPSCHIIKAGFVKNLESWSCFQNTNEVECFRNLSNIYGFDNYVQYNDYYDSCYGHLDREEVIDNNYQSTQNKKVGCQEDLNECDHSIKDLNGVNNVHSSVSLESQDFEKALSYEMNRLSASFMEKISEVKENLLRNLDGSLKQKSAQRTKGSNASLERACNNNDLKSTVNRSLSVVLTSNKEDVIIHQRSSSDTSPPQKISQIHKKDLSLQKSTSSDGTPRRRLGTRRHKLPKSSKDLFFLPPSDDDSEKIEAKTSLKCSLAQRLSVQNVEVISDDKLEQQIEKFQPHHIIENKEAKHPSVKSNASQHKKLCRSRGRYSEKDVKKISDDLCKNKLINIQTILVGEERLKIADFPDQFNRLSVKNQPRKLSIKNKYRGRKIETL